MKRKVSTICISLSLSLSLSGCGSIYSNYREIEQLLVIETMGFDQRPGGVEISLAAGISPGSREPVRLTGSGRTISAAMDNARNFSFEDELFCDQTNAILIGEDTARESMEPYLSYICQSPILRTDVPVFIIRGGRAQDAIINCGDGQHGVSEILQGVTEYLQYRGASHVFKASDIVRSSLRHGSALCCVLEYTDSTEPPVGKAQSGGSGNSQSGGGSSGGSGGSQGGSGNSGGSGGSQDSGGSEDSGAGQGTAKTLAVAGFGVLKDNRLTAFIDNEAAVGVGFLINEVGISLIELSDNKGERVVLEINDGGSRLVPRWGSSGKLETLDFYIDVMATVTEINDDSDLSDDEYNKSLTKALEDYVAERAAQVLRLSAELGADFLGLEAMVDMSQPLLWQLSGERLSSLLPELELKVAVTGRLSHTNDMKESLT